LPSPEVEVLERVVGRSGSAATEESESQPTRWEVVVGLSALVALICSVDRAAMSVALGPMGELRAAPVLANGCLVSIVDPANSSTVT